MSVIYNWIKDIVYYLILISLVFQVLPNDHYRKYIKLFTGILLVIIVLKPIRLIMNEGIFEEVKAAFHQYDYNEEEFSAQLDKLQNKQEEISKQYVGEQLKGQIQEILEDKGYYVQHVEVKNQDEKNIFCISLLKGESRGEEIFVEAILIQEELEQVESDEIKQIKEEVASYYQIEESSIQIQLGGQKNE